MICNWIHSLAVASKLHRELKKNYQTREQKRNVIKAETGDPSKVYPHTAFPLFFGSGSCDSNQD